MFNDRLWVMLGIMMVVPMIFMVVLPDPYSTVASLITNLVMLFYFRKNFKTMATSMFGGGKMKYQCLTCQGTRFDKIGACFRCGGKSKRPI